MIYKLNIKQILLGATQLLVIPAIADLMSKDFSWGFVDYVLAWLIFVIFGLSYSFLTRRSPKTSFRLATAMAIGAPLILIWMNLAVGIIGSEDHPANTIYLGVIIVEIIAILISKFESSKMAKAMYATATAQALVPVIAMIIWRPEIDLGFFGVIALNTIFVLMFIFSAQLYIRSSAQK